jgi:hypothetical protein
MRPTNIAAVIGGTAALAAITCAPVAHADGNSANLDQLVGQAYTQFQHGCTPSMTPQFQRIQWDSPPGGQGGSGRIIDGTQGLGGPFKVYWNLGNGPFPGAQKIVPAQPQGYWDIVFEFC